jgi:hypothetical protein
MGVSFGHAETFKPGDCLVQTSMRAGLLLFSAFVALSWFISAAILGALGVPVAWFFGLVLGGGVSAALWLARTRKLEAEVGAITLTLDAHGITHSNPLATRLVSWDDLRGARMVKPVVGMSTGKLGRTGMRFRTPGIDALASAAAADDLGLVGIGTITMAPSAGRIARKTYRQNETRNGTGPATRQPLVALFPRQFDVAWPNERIGEWVRHDRPDVFAEARAIWERRPHSKGNPAATHG